MPSPDRAGEAASDRRPHQPAADHDRLEALHPISFSGKPLNRLRDHFLQWRLTGSIGRRVAAPGKDGAGSALA